MITKADYMTGKATHSEYYGDVIETMGGAKSISLPVSLDVVQKALASSDKHLNSIPLARWDAAVPKLRNAKLALGQRGDYLTLGTGVCILKEAARIRATIE